jgi:hypothetical protein
LQEPGSESGSRLQSLTGDRDWKLCLRVKLEYTIPVPGWNRRTLTVVSIVAEQLFALKIKIMTKLV